MIKDIQDRWIPYDFKKQNIDKFLENLNIDKTVEISSISGGKHPAIHSGAYAAAKAGIVMLTEQMSRCWMSTLEPHKR